MNTPTHEAISLSAAEATKLEPHSTPGDNDVWVEHKGHWYSIDKRAWTNAVESLKQGRANPDSVRLTPVVRP